MSWYYRDILNWITCSSFTRIKAHLCIFMFFCEFLDTVEVARVVWSSCWLWFLVLEICSGLVYTKNNIDQTLVSSLLRLLNCEIGGLDCHVITTEYRARDHCIHMWHLFCNALVHVIYLGVSGQCSRTIQMFKLLYW